MLQLQYAIIIKLHSESYHFLRICENGKKKKYNDIACFVEAYRELQWPGRSPALRVTTWFRKWSQWSHGQWSGGRKFGVRVPLRACSAFRNLSSHVCEIYAEMKVIVTLLPFIIFTIGHFKSNISLEFCSKVNRNNVIKFAVSYAVKN